jgi:hypothetical protein
MKHLITPAVTPFGYEVRRSDSDADPGEIPAQIIRQMAAAELVIADLSDFNPNVFYELAIRHVAAKPLVQMMTAGQSLPFDVGHIRTVYFNLSDPDDLEDARKELSKHVEALQGVDEVETPIKASLRLQQALESTDPATAGNAEILAELQAMRADVERLRATQISQPTHQESDLRLSPFLVNLHDAESDPVVYTRRLLDVEGDPVTGLPDEKPKLRRVRRSKNLQKKSNSD